MVGYADDFVDWAGDEIEKSHTILGLYFMITGFLHWCPNIVFMKIYFFFD